MIDYEVAWAAGFFEGEGCFGLGGPTRRSLQITVSQKDREPLDRFKAAMGDVGTIRLKRHGHGAYFEWQLGGQDQGKLIIRLLWPGLSTRRRGQANRLLAIEPLPHANQNTRKTHCPRGHLYDQTLGTKSKRGCKTCRAVSSRRAYAKAKLRIVEATA